MDGSIGGMNAKGGKRKASKDWAKSANKTPTGKACGSLLVYYGHFAKVPIERYDRDREWNPNENGKARFVRAKAKQTGRRT